MTARYSDGIAEVHARISAVKQLVQADASAQILDEPLTDREVEVLKLFQGSMSLQQIASELHLSPIRSRHTSERSIASWEQTAGPRPSRSAVGKG